MSQNEICTCGHWYSKHKAYDEPENHYECVKGCDCQWFVTDNIMMRDLKNEHLEREYKLRRENE